MKSPEVSDETEKWPKEWPKKWPKIASKIIDMLINHPTTSIIEMESMLNVGHTTIKKILTEMQSKNMIRHIGPNRGGHWEIPPTSQL